MAERRVYLKFIADTAQWRRKMSRVQRDLAALRRKLDALSGAARTGAVAIGAAFGAALRVFVPFERAISRAGAAMSASADDMTRLRAAAKTIGRDTELTARQAGSALENFARAGLGVTDSLNLLRPAADLAVIGGIDMADAANKVTRALKVFNIESDRGPEVIDQMVVAMEQSTATMSDLSYVTELAGGSMSAFGQDISTTLALGGAIFDQLGERGAFALNALARALNDNKDRLREFGVEVFNADGSVRDMTDIIADFAERTRGMTAEQRLAAIGIIGNERAMRGLQAVLATNIDTLRENAAAVRDADGATQRWMDRLSADTMGKLKNLVSVIEDVAIRLGEHLKPQLDRAIEGVAEFIRNLKPEQITKWARTVVTIGETLVRVWVGAKVASAATAVMTAIAGIAKAYKTGWVHAVKFWGPIGILAAVVAWLPETIAGLKKLKDILNIGGGAPAGIEQSSKFQRDYAKHQAAPRRQGRGGFESDAQFKKRWARENPDWQTYATTDDEQARERAVLGRERGITPAPVVDIVPTGGGDDTTTGGDDDDGLRAGRHYAHGRGRDGDIGSAEDAIAAMQERAAEKAAAQAVIDEAELERYREHLAARIETEQQFRDEEAALNLAQAQAELDEDAERRAAEIARIGEQREALREARAAQDEIDTALRDEALAWAREHELELNEEELERLQEFLEQRRAIEQAALNDELLDKFKAAADEKKWREMTDKEKLAWLNKIAANELAILDKGGKAQAAIKKAQKLKELGMSLATDPQEAYATTSKMFGWPLGPALGAAHAALTAASILKGIKDVSGMARGGWVGGAGGVDSQPRWLSPDEFVAPRATAEQVIDARAREIADTRDDDDDREPTTVDVRLEIDGTDLAQAVVPILTRRRAGGF